MLPQVRQAVAEASRAVRQSRRADGGGRRAARGTDRRRMGHRDVRQRRGARARDRGLRRRQRSGEDAAAAVHRWHGQPRGHAAQPALCLRPGDPHDRHAHRRDRHRGRAGRGARRAGGDDRGARHARGAWLAAARASGGGGASRAASRSWSMPPPSIWNGRARGWCAAPTWSSTAAASSCAGRRPAGCCSGASALVQAAWRNASPHQALGRPMKVSKEDIIGVLAARRILVRTSATRRPSSGTGTTIWTRSPSGRAFRRRACEVIEPQGVARVPRLRVRWDRARHPLDGDGLRQALLDG